MIGAAGFRSERWLQVICLTVAVCVDVCCVHIGWHGVKQAAACRESERNTEEVKEFNPETTGTEIIFLLDSRKYYNFQDKKLFFLYISSYKKQKMYSILTYFTVDN